MQNLNKNTSTNPEVIEFLRESNAIEGIWDDHSLQDAIKAWDYLVMQKELTESVILGTHHFLMANQGGLCLNEIGNFRRCEVTIGGHHAPNYFLVPGMIKSWLALAGKIKTSKWPDEWIKQLYIQYETIHPFVDGNGRTGRMFLNYQRVKAGLPILVIYESRKYEYYEWFR